MNGNQFWNGKSPDVSKAMNLQLEHKRKVQSTAEEP